MATAIAIAAVGAAAQQTIDYMSIACLFRFNATECL